MPQFGQRRVPGLRRSEVAALAANHLGRALYADLYADPTRPPNFARFTFLDAAARRFFPDWDLAADMSVANLRTPPVRTSTTGICMTWSASCPPAARSSGAAGAPTTSGPTAPA